MNYFRTFDIETGSLPADEIKDLLPRPKYGNTKDPEKRAEIDRGHYEDALKDAALEALTGRVLAVGVKDNDGPAKIIDCDDEAELLELSWKAICSDRPDRREPLITGFGIVDFDLPFLMQRSIINSVAWPMWIRNGRYFSRQFVDLREVWGCGMWKPRGSVDTIAKACGLAGKNGHGKDYANLHYTNRAEAHKYLTNDLLQEEALAIRMGIQTHSR